MGVAVHRDHAISSQSEWEGNSAGARHQLEDRSVSRAGECEIHLDVAWIVLEIEVVEARKCRPPEL